jgi:hypothetical protein
MTLQCKSVLIVTVISASFFAARCFGQSIQEVPGSDAQAGSSVPGAAQPAGQPLSACISGSVVDQSGAVVAGAVVNATRDGKSLAQQAITGDNGQFFLANISPGAFELTISSTGFAPKTLAGELNPGEIDTVPPIVMSVAPSVTEVRVGLTQQQVATEQIKFEEQQRVLGIVPNFYVSYVPNAAPLIWKQKFQLAARTIVDPFTLIVVAGTAGLQQWQNHFVGYGQGLQGYGKRFGADYADAAVGTVIGGAILPSLLKQDPRYFYKGIGSTRSRVLYAIAMAVICKGDNRRWQPNYSNVLGRLAAGGISNLYYPSQDRDSAGLTFGNAAIGIAGDAVDNIMQEFVVPRLTPHKPHGKATQQ